MQLNLLMTYHYNIIELDNEITQQITEIVGGSADLNNNLKEETT